MVAAGIGWHAACAAPRPGWGAPDKRLIELRPFNRPEPARLIGRRVACPWARAEAARRLGEFDPAHLPRE